MNFLKKYEEHLELDTVTDFENYKQITLDQFIDENRESIIKYLRSKYPSNKKLSDSELEILIWNDSYLTNLAKKNGVKI